MQKLAISLSVCVKVKEDKFLVASLFRSPTYLKSPKAFINTKKMTCNCKQPKPCWHIERFFNFCKEHNMHKELALLIMLYPELKINHRSTLSEFENFYFQRREK